MISRRLLSVRGSTRRASGCTSFVRRLRHGVSVVGREKRLHFVAQRGVGGAGEVQKARALFGRQFERLFENVVDFLPALRRHHPVARVISRCRKARAVDQCRFTVACEISITSAVSSIRKRLRSLVKFIEESKRPTIYTDFTDSIGEEQEIALPGFDSGHNVERFLDKTQRFLKAHENDPAIHKLRFNERLTKHDMDSLEKMLLDAEQDRGNCRPRAYGGSGKRRRRICSTGAD